MEEKYLKIMDIAQILGISTTSAWRIIRKIPGAFPAAGSRCWRISNADFSSWLRERQKGGRR